MAAVRPLALALDGAWADIAIAVGLGVSAALSGLLAHKLLQPASQRRTGLVVGAVLLLAIGALHQTHLRLVFSLQTGLTWALLLESTQAGDWTGALHYAQPTDLAQALLPAATFLVSAWLPWALRLRHAMAIGMAAALVLLGLMARSPGDGGALPAEASQSPIAFTVRDFFNHRDDDEPPPVVPQPGPTLAAAPLPGQAMPDRTLPPLPAALTGTPTARGSGGMRLDAPFALPVQVRKVLPPRVQKPWNVVWIVMESTGLRYVQGETFGVLPMPYLRRLADEGWHLTRHRSPSNSSATSLVAQFTGLYPMPSLQMFSTRKDNHLPSLFDWLGAGYEKFLVTPGKLTYFFPKFFFRNAGLTEMWGFDEVPVKRNPGGEGLSKDEPEVVGFFLQRLRKARPPFAAVYYSYVAHWEYTDYGPQYRKFRGNRLIDRYHCNLWLLDRQIERIVEQLRADGLLESTILVLAGDHGEAFGQHEHNWAHARNSYDENLETPAVLWQPSLFPPRVETRDTNHVDLLPTVLDAMGVAYEDRLMQGESLFQDNLRRRFQFFWGNEGMVSVLGADGIKLGLQTTSAAGTDKACRVFDLHRDPGEKRRLACERFPEHLQVLRQWREGQRKRILAYSGAAQQGVAFEGWRHPRVR